MDAHDARFEPVVRGFRPVVAAEIQDARDEARALLEAARAEAAACLEAIDAKVAAAVADARREAFAAAEAEAAERLAAAAAVADAHAHAARHALADAVLSVAERVWGELGPDRSAAAARVIEAVRAELGGRAALRVRVHPDDVEAVAGVPGVEATTDGGLSPGDCLVEAGDRAFDGRAAVRAEIALAALAEALAPLRAGVPDAT